MRVSPINSVNYGPKKTTNNQLSFGAVFLNKATINESATGKPIDVAIIELETEWRELLADLRLKHKDDVSEEDFQKLVELKKWTRSRSMMMRCIVQSKN